MCTLIKNFNLNFALLYSITASYKKIGFFLMCILIKNINLILVYSIIYYFPSLMCTYFNLKDKTNYFYLVQCVLWSDCDDNNGALSNGHLRHH